MISQPILGKMKTKIPTLATKKWNITVAVASFVLLGYIGFLLFANYLSQVELQTATLQQLKQDMEKRSMAVSYFYSERKSDLKDLRENRDILAYFHSKALGMSMEYGLQASLFSVTESFSRLLNEKTLDQEKIYTQIAFIKENGQLLSGAFSSESRAKNVESLSHLLSPELGDAAILVDSSKQDPDVIVSIAYDYKGKYKGQIVAWVSSATVYKQLVKETSTEVGRSLYIIPNKGELGLPSDIRQKLKSYAMPDLEGLEAGKIYRIRPSARHGKYEELIAGRFPVKGTPFSLLILSEASDIFGKTAPWRLPIAMGILSLIILGGTAFALKVNTHNLVLRTRLEETARSKQDVETKNRQLEKEISERRRVEAALKESEEKYRILVDNTNEGIFIYQDDVIKFPNRRLLAITGYSEVELTGMSFSDLLHPDEQESALERHTRSLKEGEVAGDYVCRTLNKAGEQLWFEVNAVRHTWEKKTATLNFVRDITPQKKLEAQLLHAHKMEAVGTLAGGIAHDFNNLLQAIQGYSELLLLDDKENEPSHDHLKEIFSAAQRGADLTKQLLTFSRKIESKLQPVDLNQEIVQLRKLLDRTIPKMISIELHLAGDLMTINADPAQMEQVLMNLAVNARDAMPEGGKLTVATRNAILDEPYCRIHMGAVPGNYVLLQVTDTGHGMDTPTLGRIFEPFFTSKGIGRGTGLGLAMVYGIVKSHKGYITCRSEPGRGTTFDIYLPVIDREERDMEKPLEPVVINRGSETILLVDDEDYIRDLGKQILSRFGYTVWTAENGETALEIYATHWNTIDLVLLDLIMPGMSGTECLRELQRINPSVRVVVISGYSPDDSRDELIELGAEGFISKPYEMNQMLQVTRKVLDKKQGSSGNETTEV